jgi:beta-glucosidase
MINFAGPVSQYQTAGFLLRILLGGLMFMGIYPTSDAAWADDQQTLDKSAPTSEVKVSDHVIFAGGKAAPWRLYLGSSNNWMVPVQGPETTSHKSKVITVRTIDNGATADAIQAEWQGSLGQVYWQEDKPWDLRALAKQGGALSMVVRVDKEPKKAVDVKMDCGYPCAGTLNLTHLFKSVPEGKWFRISLKLNCFKEAGANLEHIISPLVVATKGDFIMSFADVRLLTTPPVESLVACR